MRKPKKNSTPVHKPILTDHYKEGRKEVLGRKLAFSKVVANPNQSGVVEPGNSVVEQLEDWSDLPPLNLYGSSDIPVTIPDPGPCEDETPICIPEKLSISDKYAEGIVILGDSMERFSCTPALLKR